MASALNIETHEGSEQGSFAVNSHLICGEHEAILVDTQYVRSDARDVIEMIRRSGKQLRSIFITHSHPDHHLGLQVITDEYPEAEVLATGPVVESIKREGPENIARWKPVLGANLADGYVVPVPVEGSLKLDDQIIQVIDVGPGEAEVSSALYIPSLKALISADAIYNGVHVWLVEGRPREQLDTIRHLRSIGEIERVYPGHGPVGGPELFASNERYITDFLEATASPAAKDQALAEMQGRYGTFRVPLILQWSVEAAITKKGRVQILDEFIASFSQSA